MSLDVYLEDDVNARAGSGIFIREDGRKREISMDEWNERFPGAEPVVAEVESAYLYSGNITHNLGPMARAAGIYRHLWCPDELGITHACQLVAPLREGLATLRAEPDKFRKYNAPNRWGLYENLVDFVGEYLAACEENPDSLVNVWR